MNFGRAVVTCFKKYIDFRGRAVRSEYWWFALFVILTNLVVTALGHVTHIPHLGSVISLAFFLPQVSVGVRRLHDVNQPGWWIAGLYLIVLLVLASDTIATPYFVIAGVAIATSGISGLLKLIGFACAIVVFAFSASRGTAGPNDYGADPLAEVNPPTLPAL
jgi:uncharacterized membrane protein YhaH (DUF805 family)